MSDEREADIATLTIDYLQAEIREVALDVLTDYSPEDPPSDADIAYAQRQADAIASRWAMHRDATFADETLRVPASSEPRPEVRDCPLMHGAAPCPMCAYCPHGLTAGRGADERCLECGAAVTEPRPENPYRTVHARMSPPGAAWDEGFASRQPEIDRLEAERDEARLETWRIVHKCPSCDRYFDSPSICSDGTYTVEQLERVPDGTWPDQSAQHGVLLDQIKDAYAEGIADTIDRLRVRAAEMLPEVARFTLDEIEVAAAATPDPPPCRCPDDWRYDDGSVSCPRHPTKPDAPAASPDERLREALREVVAAFPSPPDREMDDEEIERWYADHGDWFRRLTALIATDRRGTSDE